ncbi:hypothetical protein F4779DRAFT_339375 [Xylariaceae sp. FL0662B]|nr:hypothetical protein F4779DRAFT_339375 [Xylariaceae sp. FL0662B]
MDDIPPPPYTETDIYSHPGRAPAVHTGSNDDDASVAASSTQSNIIYTPPETPQESHHDFAGNDDQRTTASAQAYFESRPAIRQALGPNLVISLAITQDASPDDFPYPDWARGHETTQQDWQTFLNHLAPNHAASANAHVINRKLQAENGAQSTPTGRDIAAAQLGRLQSSSRPSRNLDAVIHEWNDGFFGPRGVTVVREPPSAAGTPRAASLRDDAVDPQPRPREQHGGSRWNPFAGSGGRLDDPRSERGRGRGPGRGRGSDRGCGRGRGRGRRHDHHHHHHDHDGAHRRSRSTSSSSSSSSTTSTASSPSTIGSLPSSDDLSGAQLPLAKQSVSAWLAHPEQPVTRAMVKNARADLKAAAKQQKTPSSDAVVDQERQRAEVRALLARFRQLKKEQKARRRAARRERRALKKAARRERRARRGEMRRGRHGGGDATAATAIATGTAAAATSAAAAATAAATTAATAATRAAAGAARAAVGAAGRGRGRGRGRGGPFGPPGPPSMSMPGFPLSFSSFFGGGRRGEEPTPTPDATTRSRYEAAAAALAAKKGALDAAREEVAREGVEAAKRGEGDVKTKAGTEAQREVDVLELEIEHLGRQVERLRVQVQGEGEGKEEERKG